LARAWQACALLCDAVELGWAAVRRTRVNRVPRIHPPVDPGGAPATGSPRFNEPPARAEQVVGLSDRSRRETHSFCP
jgi:hypothetical protein